MQNYNINSKETNIPKSFILECLDYLRYKIEGDRLTLSELDSLRQVMASSLKLTGSVKDLAGFYGKSENNVKVVICRKMTARPRREVTYSFNEFRKVVPDSWKD